MTDLPARPDLGQLRRQAKELLRAATAGDSAATARIRAASDRMTLAAAQRALAREYGFASWGRLKAEVDARSASLAELVDQFIVTSIRDRSGRAARMLAANPEIAGYDVRTAVVLGDAGRVRELLGRDPELARRPDARSGWTPLHAVCASRWNQFDPTRADGLTAVARLLLDAGADPAGPAGGRPGDWTPLRCAAAAPASPAITRLLLERGARPEDSDLYLACFADDGHETLALLLSHAPDLIATTALASPMSVGDTEGVRLALRAGASPRRPLPSDLFGDQVPERVPGAPLIPPVAAAVTFGCPAEMIALLLDAGGDPDAPDPDGDSPYRMAVRRGRNDVAELLARHGARDDTTDTDRFLLACRQGDRHEAERLLRAAPELAAGVGGDGESALVDAAGHGQADAVRLMLDLGFPLEARGANGGTPMHAAALSGSEATVNLLLARGAQLESRDTSWNDTPLGWAVVGSGLAETDNPAADWIGTIRALIAAGASTAEITLSPDDPKPPSPEVAAFLRDAGIAGLTSPPGG